MAAYISSRTAYETVALEQCRKRGEGYGARRGREEREKKKNSASSVAVEGKQKKKKRGNTSGLLRTSAMQADERKD